MNWYAVVDHTGTIIFLTADKIKAIRFVAERRITGHDYRLEQVDVQTTFRHVKAAAVDFASMEEFLTAALTKEQE